MRQFLESVILFNGITCRYSPVTKYFPNKLEITDYERYLKFGVFTALLIVISAIQVLMFTSGKQLPLIGV